MSLTQHQNGDCSYRCIYCAAEDADALHHKPCPGGCGELEDECMTPGCGNPLGSMRIRPGVGS
jgi:hypothetical protein